MKVEVFPDADAVARAAAGLIAADARAAVAARGRFTLAVVGATRPGRCSACSPERTSPGVACTYFQVDERVAPLAIRTETSPTSSKASSARCLSPRRSCMPCQWKPRT